MKSKKTTKHIIAQRTAAKKRARKLMRPQFRAIAKALRSRRIKDAQTKIMAAAKEIEDTKEQNS